MPEVWRGKEDVNASGVDAWRRDTSALRALMLWGVINTGRETHPQVGGSGGGKEKRMLPLPSSCVRSSDTKLPIMTHDVWEPSNHLGRVAHVCQRPLLLAINLALSPTAVWS